MIVKLEGQGNLYERLSLGVRRAILEGRLLPGTRLPSTRALAAQLGLSRNVVLLAFAQLLDERYLEARVGSGTYVASTVPDAALVPWKAAGATPVRTPATRLSAQARRIRELAPLPPPGAPLPGYRLPYDFRYGRPAADDFPHAKWCRQVTRRARSMSIRTLWYGRSRGYGPLREAIADYLRRARGLNVSVDQVLVVNGTQQGIDLAARLLLDPGDRVVVEEPSYQAARQVFQTLGARLVPAPVDAEGLDPSRLPRSRKIRLAYVTPSHQFPLGGILPSARRVELLRWAEQLGAHILEDDYDSEFRYEGRPVEAVQALDRSGRVLYVGSFSKVLFPSLRVGYLVLPEALVPTVAAFKFLTDYQTPTFEQEVLADFMREGHFERHLRRARARNAERRAVLLEALAPLGERVEVVGAEAGIHLVVWLRDVPVKGLPALVVRAAERGLGIYPVTPYYFGRAPRAGLLLGYACLSLREIRTGIRILGELL